MALVLVGCSSYGVSFVNEDGVPTKRRILKNQDVEVMGLPTEVLEELRAAKIGTRPVFAQVGKAPAPKSGHSGGTIDMDSFNAVAGQKRAEEAALKAAAEEAKPAPHIVVEAVAEVEEAPVPEEAKMGVELVTEAVEVAPVARKPKAKAKAKARGKNSPKKS